MINFYKKSLRLFLKTYANLIIFLPYYFSVKKLIKTLFNPWKNLIARKKSRGFSFQELGNRLFFNFVSRSIGFFMRSGVLFLYLLTQIIFVILSPLSILVYIFFIPFLYFLSLFFKTNKERDGILKKEFVQKHTLEEANKEKVILWFENFFKKEQKKREWWQLENLLSIPPLARDWAVGYTPNLDNYSQELTSEKYLSSRRSIVDRKNEIRQIEETLIKSRNANVIIVGDNGVGKRTIVDAFSSQIYRGKSNPLLVYRRVLNLNMEKILSKYTDQKKREMFIEELFKEASDAKNIVLFIDQIDRYLSEEKERVNLSSSIEKFATTNRLQMVGVTTPFFYQKFVFNNEKIFPIFTKIDVYEIDQEKALKILLDFALELEKKYKLIIPYQTIKTTIIKSNFYITDIPFPEKAIDLLEEVCVLARENKEKIALPKLVDTAISQKTHIATSLTEQMREKLNNLESLLKKSIIHQDEAVKKLSQSLKRAFLIMGKRKKPLATFLFFGPTGVGKTETAKAISRLFFGSEKHLIRFDMSLYQSKNDIPKLIGSMETNNPGLLSKAIRENPYGVLLFDEIEKADKDLINIFLTIIDEGYFTDGFGKKVNCKNLTIIATSNAGSDLIFNNKIKSHQEFINIVVNQGFFSPEFLNRFDGIIIYKPLSKLGIKLVAKKILKEIYKNIYQQYQVKVTVSDQFLEKIINRFYDVRLGARNMKRVIAENIENRLADLILKKEVKRGEVIEI